MRFVSYLRRIKVHFLLRPGGPAHGRHVEVWSVGKSLDEWAAALQEHPNVPPQVTTVNWKPGMPLPDRWKAPRQKQPQERKERGPGSLEAARDAQQPEGMRSSQKQENAGSEEPARDAQQLEEAAEIAGRLVDVHDAPVVGRGGAGDAGESKEGGSGPRSTVAGKEGKTDGARGVVRGVAWGEGGRPVRLFVFGMAKARRSVSSQVRDWDDELDWFVA